ncbi:MAG: hypothetical protein HQ546_01910, partial [Planctomycetes bacterium]|nr:hypothetical protein [Planctomycetota bacterium]
MCRQVRAFQPGMLCACIVSITLLCGCTDGMRQYTRLGDWPWRSDKPLIISGSPGPDASAYANADEDLSEADWRVLEQFAPRPIWKKIADAKQRLGGDDEEGLESVPSYQPAGSGDIKEKPVKPPRNVPTVVKPDGQIELFYRLGFVGGVTVTSAYEG